MYLIVASCRSMHVETFSSWAHWVGGVLSCLSSGFCTSLITGAVRSLWSRSSPMWCNGGGVRCTVKQRVARRSTPRRTTCWIRARWWESSSVHVGRGLFTEFVHVKTMKSKRGGYPYSMHDGWKGHPSLAGGDGAAVQAFQVCVYISGCITVPTTTHSLTATTLTLYVLEAWYL